MMMRLCYFYTKRGYKSTTKLLLLFFYLLEMLLITTSKVQKHLHIYNFHKLNNINNMTDMYDCPPKNDKLINMYTCIYFRLECKS